MQPKAPCQAAPAASEEPALLHRSLIDRPLKVERASGSHLELENGRRILDACGGAAVSIIGHGNTEVLDAVAAQMSRVSYVHTMAYTTESAEALARSVLQQGPDAPLDHGLVKAFFVGSGSEANDAAMKCARQFWVEKGQSHRRHFVSRRNGYHGNTIGAMSVSGIPSRKEPYLDILLPHVSTVAPADAYHGMAEGETEAQFVARLLADLEGEFLRIGPENIISFMAETVSGAALGSMPAPVGYWTGVRTLCDKHDILLHLDEVMCGSGRCGTYFAFEQEGIKPDMVTIGKGLGGGYAPIAGMLINERIVDGLRQGSSVFNHGHTYQAHPVSCAAALAVQKIIRRDNLLAQCVQKGEILKGLLEPLRDLEHVGDIRGRGLFWTVEFVRDKKSKTPFPLGFGFGPKVQAAALAKGVALYPGAGDFVIFAPAYIVSADDLAKAVSVLREAYDEVVSLFQASGQ